MLRSFSRGPRAGAGPPTVPVPRGPKANSYQLPSEDSGMTAHKYFVRLDVTEQFPFLVTKMSPYYNR